MKITTLKSVFKSFFLALILLVFHIEFSSAQNSSKKSEQTHKQGLNNRLLAPIQITGNFSICLPGPSTTQLTGSGGSGNPRPVTPWQSSNPLVATVDNTGLVTQVGFGTTTITYYDDAGNQTSQNVYVSTYPTVSGPTASPSACAGGGQVQLTGSLFPHPTTPWTSANTSIATVDNNGLVTGVGAGIVNITYMNFGGCTASIPVTINPLLSPSISCGIPTYNSVTFTWPAVSGAATYTVVYSINTGAWVFGTSGNITSWTKNGLNPGDSVTVFITPSGAAGNCFTGAFQTCVALSCDAFSTPTAPVIGTITQPTCATATGSVQLTGLPAGAWIINPGAIAGSGATYTVTGLATGSYTFTVKNSFGCTSVASASATINAQPPTPATPTIGTITQTTCASATGSVQLTGLPAGAWTINPGAIAGSGATYTVSGLAAGTYNFTVTNAVGCPSAASASATINTQPATPAAPTIGTITQTTCASSTGSIELTGLPAGAWTINPGAIAGSGATYTVSGLVAGSYSYTVTNAAGCTSVASVSTIINTQPTTPVAPIIGTITQTTCASPTGSVQLNGLPAGAWTINPGAIAGSGATYTVSGLAAGTYNFTVTNAVGCPSSASASATINTQPPTPAAPTIGTITQTTCASATGSIELTGLPAGAWTINPGAIAGSGATYTVSGLAAGTYNFTVTNAAGCTSVASASATINTQPTTPAAPTIGTITQTTCATATGSVQLTGLPAGAWIINPGAIAGSGATYTVSGLAAGTYNFTVTNASSCSSAASASATINTQPATPAAPTIGTITQTTCASATGSVQLTGLPAGAWTINPGAIAGSGATYTVSGLAAGTYNFTVTNAVGCTSISSASATINTQPATPAAPTIGTITQTTCASATGSVQLTGLPAGAWTINPGAIAGSGATYTVSGLAAGTYNFTVTNAVGCTSVASVSTTINTQPTTPAAPTIGTITQTTCATATGSVQLTGLPAGAWIINPGAIAGSGATYTVSGLAAGTYNFTVTNASSCSSAASASATINTQPATPAAPTIGTITQTTCASATGSVQLTGLPAGAWTINPGAIAGSGATYTVSGLAAGTYNFTVTNAVGCPSAASASATINTQPATPVAPTIGTITQTTCASATGSVQLTGLPAGAWTINPGAIAGSGATYTVSGLAAGTYNFTVTNAAGCTSVASVSTIINTQPTTPVAPIIGTITQTTCASPTGSIELTGLPVGAWTINPGAIAGSGATYTVSGLVAGSYSYTVTNAAGCTSAASASATINTQPATPAAPTIGTITQTTCASATGSVQLTGLPAGAWTINPGAIAGSGATYTVSGLAAGTYNFTVTNAVGCTSVSSASATINTQPGIPTTPTSTGNITQCEQSPIQTLDANNAITPVVGINYSWFTAASGGASVATPTLNTVGTVTYYVEANDGTCSSLTRTAVTLTINPAPAAPTSTGNITQCEQSPIQTLDARNAITTVAGINYSWFTAASAGTLVATPTLNTVGTVTYYVEANDGTCSSLTRTAVTLTINPAPAAPTSTGNITQCEQSPIQTLDARNAITTVTGINYSWYTAASAGASVATPTLNTVGTVTYYVEANDGTCSSYARTAVTLTINPAPAAPTSTGNITQCEQSPIQTLDARNAITTVTGINYSWFTAASAGASVATPTLNTVGTVTYYVEANDGTCSSLTRTAVTLTINPAPAAPTSTGNITQCEQSPIQTLDANNAITPVVGINYTWFTAASGGASVATPTLNTVGTVTYYVEANDGTCSSLTRTAVTLTINPAPAAPSSTGNITQCEQSPIQTLDARNAITPVIGINYTWYTAASGGASVVTPTLNTVGTVTYYVEANDGTCSSLTRTAVTLTINPAPAAPTSTGNITQCEQSPIQTLDANNAITPVVGINYTWFTAASGGASVATPTLNTVGTVTYYVEANDGTCSSLTRTAVTLTINPAPAAPTSTGNITQCEQSPIQTLDARNAITTVAGINYSWFTAASAGTLVATPTLNTVGTVTYYVEANDGTCSSLTRTAVTLTINPAPAAPSSTGNITQCEQSPIQTLDARNAITPVIGINYTWYTAASGGASVATPTLNTIGTVTYYVEANDGTCPSLTRTAVTLTINPAPAAPISTGNITQCEQSPIQTLDANNAITPVVGINYSWYTAASAGASVATPTLNTVGTVTYYVEANDGTCSSLTRTAVTLTINPAPAAPTSTGNITQCEQSPIQTLDANNAITTVAGINYSWFTAASAGALVATPTLNTVGTVTYYVEANDGTCPSYARTAVTLTINPAPAAPSSTGNITQCEQSPIQTLDARNAITPVIGINYTWYDAPTAGLVVATPTLNTVGTVTYYVEANDGTCPSLTRTAVTLTINPAPAAPTSTGNITQCEQSPIQTLDANNAITTVAGINYSWFTAASAGASVATPTLNTVGTVTYYVEANDGTCSSLTRTAVTLTINPAPAAPSSTGNITQCEQSPIQTLDARNAITTVAGINYSWYNLPNGGTIVSSPTLNIVGSITYYVEANDGTCPSYARTAVTLTINPAPAAPISTGNITECEQLPMQILNANNAITSVSGQTVTWYDAPTGGNIVFSPTWSSLGSIIYYGESNDGTCPSYSRTPVTLTIIPAPGAPIFGNDTTVCAQSPLQTLTAMAVVPPGQTVRWYNAPTGGTLVLNPILNSIGTVTYYGQTFDGNCNSTTRLPVVLTINPSPAAPIPGGNITQCEQSPIQTLTATATVPAGQTIVWYDAPVAGNVVLNPTLNTPGTVTYYPEATDGTCTSLTRTAVTLTIEPAPAAPVSGGNITVCEQFPLQTITATATAGIGQTVSWFTSPTGGTPISSPTLSAIGSVTYFAEASQGSCKSFTRTPVTLTINAAPPAPIAGGNITQCANNPIQTLTATATPANAGDVITWFDAPSGGNIVLNPQLNTFGAVTYYAESSNGLCPSLTRSAVTLTLNAKPSAPTVIITQPDCTTSTGSFTVFPVAPGVTYSYDGGPFTSTTFYDLIADNSTHTLVAQNISNCTSSITNIVIQQQPATPNAPAVTVTQPSCTLATGTIDITPVAGETYSFDNGPYVSTINYPNLFDGSTHTIRAKNTAGCFSSITTILLDVQPTTPSAPVLTATQPSCSNPTGSISVAGNIGETYSIDGGPFTSNLTYPSLAAGSIHNVRAQNAAGCISVASSFTLDPQPPTPGTPVYTVTQPTCTDDFGSVDITPVPGELYSFDGGPYTAILNYPNLASASTHTIVAQNSFGCESVAAVININPQPITPLPVLYDGVICVDEITGVPYKTYILDTQLNLATHTFVWYFNGNVTSDTGNAIQVTQPGLYGVIATNINGCSSALVTAQISSSSPGLSFDTEVSNQFSNDTSVIITVNAGTGPFLYQMDFGPLQESNIFNSVTPGTHHIKVTDAAGCTDLSDEVLVLGYPNFFTPNGDGFNDTWNIVGLEQHPDTEIYIFDRHGKFIKQISSTTDGWDGTMNGQPLPSTDYWFRAEYTDKGQRKEFKSHFSLVR